MKLGFDVTFDRLEVPADIDVECRLALRTNESLSAFVGHHSMR
jgi:hypothetical protein